MNDTDREAFFFMFIGHNRTGKTVTAKDIAIQWKKAHKGKLIVFDPQNRFTDITDIRIRNIEDVGNLFIEDEDISFSEPESLFIVDDYRALYPKDKLDETLGRLLEIRNEYCVDMIFITHSPKLIQERLTYIITHYFLYFTLGVDKGFKDKVYNAEVLIVLREEINSYVIKHGKGEYDKRSFPYIIFHNISEETEYVNFN